MTMDFLRGAVVENPPASAGEAGDMGLAPGSGRSLRGRNGNPLWYSCLENPMDSGAWGATVHGLAKSHARLCMHTWARGGKWENFMG